MGELLNRFFPSVFSKEQGRGDRNVARGEDDQAGVGGGGGEGISVVITEVMVREHLARLVRTRDQERMAWDHRL